MAAPATVIRGIFSRALPSNATAEYDVETDTQITNVALDGDKPGRTVVKLRYLDYEKAMQSVPGYLDDDSDFDEDEDSELEGEIDMEDSAELKAALEKAVEVNGVNGTNEVVEASDASDDDDDDDSALDGLVETKEVILCSLTAGGLEQFSCNLLLPRDTACEFIVTGPNAVHLLGHFVEQFDPAHDDYDEEGYGESDDESINSDEMGVYDPDDEGAPLHQMGMADAAMLAAGSDDDDEDDESDLMDEDADRFAEVADADVAAIEAERRARAALLKPSPSPAKKAAAPLPKADKPAPAAAAPAPKPATAAGDVSLEGLSKNQRKKALKKLKAEGAAASADAAPATAAASKPAAAAKPTAAAPASAGKKPSKKQTLDNGLVIEDHKNGDGAAAANGKRVGVRYIGKLQNGKVFDSNTKGAPFTFRLGKGEVIKGWDQGIAGMQVGGERKLTIPASLAYGKAGTDGIPGNATLTFDVKLLSVK